MRVFGGGRRGISSFGRRVHRRPRGEGDLRDQCVSFASSCAVLVA